MSDDLIRRSDAMRVALWFSKSELKYSPQFVKKRVMEIPTAEPKRGEWEEKETFYNTDDNPIIEEWQSARCSVCHKYHTTPYMYYFNDYNFCPNCGADMRNSSEKPNNCELQTIRCPKCGRTDYIRDMEKDMGIKGSHYKYKCINCNTYIKDEPTISKMEQVEDEPQMERPWGMYIVDHPMYE